MSQSGYIVRDNGLREGFTRRDPAYRALLATLDAELAAKDRAVIEDHEPTLSTGRSDNKDLTGISATAVAPSPHTATDG